MCHLADVIGRFYQENSLTIMIKLEKWIAQVLGLGFEKIGTYDCFYNSSLK